MFHFVCTMEDKSKMTELDVKQFDDELRRTYDERGLRILKERYARKGETPAGAMWRVCKCVAGDGNEEMAKTYMEHLLVPNRFLPNTPTWTGAGVGKGQLAACFVLPIEDTMESIFGTLRDAALIQSTGGGTGFNFGHLRPKGSVVNSSQGSSSGPVSFIGAYDAVFATVQQGGCLTPDALVHTSRGTLTLGELVDPDLPGWHPHELSVQTELGERPSKLGFNNGKSEVMRLLTDDGISIVGTPEHKFRICREDGKTMGEWVEMRNVKHGDRLVVMCGQHRGETQQMLAPYTDEDIKFPEFMDDRLAYLCGFMSGQSQFSAPMDTDHPTILRDMARSLFPGCVVETTVDDRSRRCRIFVVNDCVRRFFHANGITPPDVSVPRVVRQSPASVVEAYLRGMFVSASNGPMTTEYSTTSEALAKQVAVLLIGTGWTAKIVDGSQMHKRVICGARSSSVITYSVVKSIARLPHTCLTLDLEVEGCHSYVANGLVTHNTRRGANMAILPVSHPDVLEFIECKSREGDISHFNLSVSATDAFMRAVKSDGTWDLVDPGSHKVVSTVSARELFSKIVDAGTKNGEPGIVFIDAINRDNPMPGMFHIEATNPCVTADCIINTWHGPRTVSELVGIGFITPSGVLVPGGFFRTKSTTELVRVTTRMGYDILCTPEHRLMLSDGTWKPACTLVANSDYLKLCSSCFRVGGKGTPLRIVDTFAETIKTIRNVWEMSGRPHEGMVFAKSSMPPEEIRRIHMSLLWMGIPCAKIDVGGEDEILLKPEGHRANARFGILMRAMTDVSAAMLLWEKMDMETDSLCDPVMSVSIEDVAGGPVDVYDAHCEGGEPVLWTDAFLSHNCSEVPLSANESCCLGSINLKSHIRVDTQNGPRIDWTLLENTIHTSVRFLDDVITANKFVPAVSQLAEAAKSTRRIGLGFMGLADIFFILGIRYGSPESLSLASQIAEFLRYHSMLASARLAAERGSFPHFRSSKYYTGTWRVPVSRCTCPKFDVGRPENLNWEWLRDTISRVGMRNITTTAIAPTGTLSLVAGVSGFGCEPVFALAHQRRILDRQGVPHSETMIVPELMYALCTHPELSSDPARFDRAAMHVKKTGGRRGSNDVPPEVSRVFVSASDVSVDEHVAMQSVLQAYVDGAISKTINLPPGSTRSDVERALMLAWESGCKGICVYVAGSRECEVLTSGSSNNNNK